jgi:hypothetical protein
VCSAQGRVFNNMLYVRNAHLTKDQACSQTLNHILITLIVNYGVDCKFAIRDKHIFSSQRMLHKEYYRKSSVEKKFLVLNLKGLDVTITRLAVNRQS